MELILYSIIFFPNVLAGNKVQMFGNLDKLHSYIYLKDFAKGLVMLAENEKAFGEVWILPYGETLTTRNLIELIFEEAGVESNGKISSNPKIMLTIGEIFMKMVREIKEVIYQAEIDWVVDSSKFEKVFKVSATPHREAIRETLEWYRSHQSTS